MTFAALKLAICDVTVSAPLLSKLLTALRYMRSFKWDAGIPSATNKACPSRQNCRFYCEDSEQSCAPQSLI